MQFPHLLVVSDDERQKSSASMLIQAAQKRRWATSRATVDQVSTLGVGRSLRLFVRGQESPANIVVFSFVHPDSVTRLALYEQALGSTPSITVFNTPAGSLRVVDDKWSTLQLCKRLGVSTPPTAQCSLDRPLSILDALDTVGYPAWIKTKVGSGGRQVVSIRDPKELLGKRRLLLERIASQEPLYRYARRQSDDLVVQRHIGRPLDDPERSDFRIDMIDGEMIGATRRTGAKSGEGTNLNQGAVGLSALEDPALRTMVAISRVLGSRLGLDRASFDFLQDGDSNLYLNEINAFPWLAVPSQCVAEGANSLSEAILDHAFARHISRNQDGPHQEANQSVPRGYEADQSIGGSL